MELREGYKETEVGVIPEEWEVVPIIEIANVTTGSRNTQDKDATGKYPFFVRSQTVERIDSFSYEGEAILTAGDGVGTGKVFHYVDGKFDVHQRVYQLYNFSNRVLSKYIFLVFSRMFYERIMQMTAKSSVDSVRREMIANMAIPLPPLPEQRFISTALGDADALLSALDGLIAKKEALKQGAMQALLTGERRLPGFDGMWEQRRLGEVATVIGGGTPSTRDDTLWGGKVQWFTPTEVGATKYLGQSRRTLSNAGLNRSGASMLPIGTVLLTSRAGIGDVGILECIACTNQGFQSLVVTGELSNEFIYYWVLSHTDDLLERASGSTFLEISPANVRSIKLSLPTLPEQIAIAAVLSDMDAEVEALRVRRAKAAAVKAGMMGDLLGGRVRLV